jgi:hypothetical protein
MLSTRHTTGVPNAPGGLLSLTESTPITTLENSVKNLLSTHTRQTSSTSVTGTREKHTSGASSTLTSSQKSSLTSSQMKSSSGGDHNNKSDRISGRNLDPSSLFSGSSVDGSKLGASSGTNLGGSGGSKFGMSDLEGTKQAVGGISVTERIISGLEKVCMCVCVYVY